MEWKLNLESYAKDVYNFNPTQICCLWSEYILPNLDLLHYLKLSQRYKPVLENAIKIKFTILKFNNLTFSKLIKLRKY